MIVVASAFTEDLIALVSFGKSPLAELTSAFASLWIFAICACSPLSPLPELRSVSPLTELSRLARLVQ